MKYTKNLHMHHLNDGNKAMDPEAAELMATRLATPHIKGRNTKPHNIGQWLQVTHRDVFNRDFELHVAKHRLTKHCMSK